MLHDKNKFLFIFQKLLFFTNSLRWPHNFFSFSPFVFLFLLFSLLFELFGFFSAKTFLFYFLSFMFSKIQACLSSFTFSIISSSILTSLCSNSFTHFFFDTQLNLSLSFILFFAFVFPLFKLNFKFTFYIYGKINLFW